MQLVGSMCNWLAVCATGWQYVQLVGNKHTIFIEQSKTDPFRCGYTITIHISGTSTCPVRALQLYVEAVLQPQDYSPVLKEEDFPH